jgi:hypothetical protein
MSRHVFMLAGLLAGCSAPPATGFFPLEPGHRWTYDVKTEWENQWVEHETLVLSTLGRESLGGEAAWRRRSDSGADYWLRSDATGIYRVASKSDLEREPRPDAQPRYVLKMPLAAGTAWSASTTPYLLKRRGEFQREARQAYPAVPMVYTIEAQEPLRTRAGSFDGCWRVKGRATVRIYADRAVGWRDMPLTTTEWYCDGVGLARLQREEPAQSPFLLGGTLMMELPSWR